MFAFAIWDARRRRLFCARDRLGIKPFYYYWDGRLFAFASEIKALLEHPAISPALDEDLLPELLAFGYTSGERTLFRSIRKLMPGHHLVLDLRGGDPSSRCERYWDVPADCRPARGPSTTKWIAETRRRLEESVEMQLMSDVPLGVFLSGGVDSSAIAALRSALFHGPVKPSRWVIAEALQRVELRAASGRVRSAPSITRSSIGMDDFFDALPQLIWHEDEPIAWPSSVSLYFVSKLAAAAGEGGAHRRGQRRAVRRVRALSLA